MNLKAFPVRFVALIYMMLLSVICQSSSTIDVSETSTIRNSKEIVSGYFTGVEITNIHRRQTVDASLNLITVSQVETHREFYVTNVVSGRELEVGTIISITTVGGKSGSLETAESIILPQVGEDMILGLQGGRSADGEIDLQFHVTHEKVFLPTKENDLEGVARWAKEVHEASNEEYSRILDKERESKKVPINENNESGYEDHSIEDSYEFGSDAPIDDERNYVPSKTPASHKFNAKEKDEATSKQTVKHLSATTPLSVKSSYASQSELTMNDENIKLTDWFLILLVVTFCIIVFRYHIINRGKR